MSLAADLYHSIRNSDVTRASTSPLVNGYISDGGPKHAMFISCRDRSAENFLAR
ncbi:hypothetical protein HMPREF9538_06131 [Klebsiella sp. MS 92-3]|nr:hypothetical protein HMPREF9538_06131 [Klebsiella sp. MS 92-3]